MLCSVLLNTPILSTSNTYVNWKDLALTSCALLDTSRTYCFRVDATGGAQRAHAAASVVGFDILATGRRRRRNLLEAAGHATGRHSEFWRSEEEEVAHHMLHEASWSGAGEVCAGLVAAYRGGGGGNNITFGVLDRHVLKECLHWRLITNHTIAVYNWTRAAAPDDEFLLSWHGFAKVGFRLLGTRGKLDVHPPSLRVCRFVRGKMIVVRRLHTLVRGMANVDVEGDVNLTNPPLPVVSLFHRDVHSSVRSVLDMNVLLLDKDHAPTIPIEQQPQHIRHLVCRNGNPTSNRVLSCQFAVTILVLYLLRNHPIDRDAVLKLVVGGHDHFHNRMLRNLPRVVADGVDLALLLCPLPDFGTLPCGLRCGSPICPIRTHKLHGLKHGREHLGVHPATTTLPGLWHAFLADTLPVPRVS
jgi:hypothetical protein